MKVYIAGKITGDMHYVDKFREHEKYLKKQGHTVLTPHRLPEGMTKGDYMRICFAMIDSADVVYLLPDWFKSHGAILEYLYCRYVGKSVWDSTTYKRHYKHIPHLK